MTGYKGEIDMEMEKGRRMMRHGAYTWSYGYGYPCIVLLQRFFYIAQ